MKQENNGIPLNMVNKQGWLTALKRDRISLLTCYYPSSNALLRQRQRVITNHQLLFIEDGALAVEIGGQELQLYSGDMVWLPPGTERRYVHESASRPIKHMRLRLQLLRAQRHMTWTRDFQYRRDAWNCLPVFQLLHRQIQGHGTFQQDLSINYMQALSMCFFDLPEQVQDGFFRPQQKMHIDRHIREHLACGPRDLADIVGVTHDYFARQFKQVYQITPQAYIKQLRMQMAAQDALQLGLSSQNLAEKYCSGNASLFCRQFKQVHGCSVRQYCSRHYMDD